MVGAGRGVDLGGEGGHFGRNTNVGLRAKKRCMRGSRRALLKGKRKGWGGRMGERERNETRRVVRTVIRM